MMSKRSKANSMETEIRRRIEKRFKQRSEYFSHLVAFMLVNGVGWAIFLQGNNSSSTVCAGISIIWTIAFIIDTVQFIMSELQERTIQREIERERMLRYGVGEMTEKTKNRLMRLTDDGEIMDFDEEESDETLKMDNRRD
ncbi:MAG: 2TM domain-containing protein [Anaerolineae bacterium]|nr:2TM domain-containing protein [Anaerolineae bacterium]